MPEGDMIRRAALALVPLVGETLERATTQGLERDLAGRTVTAVHAHGKHLLIDLDDATQLRTHLGMNGRVRLLARADGEARLARMSPGRATLVLVTRAHVALWTQAPTVEIAQRRAPMRGLAVASLGPDVLADDFDPTVAAARAAEHPSRPIADVLLDQRVAAGIGNIWKCESLFARGIDPTTPVGALAADELTALFAAARELMQARLESSARNARRPYAVYSRTNQPCPRCSTPIRLYRLGTPPRWTWSCPRCQPAGAVAGDSR